MFITYNYHMYIIFWLVGFTSYDCKTQINDVIIRIIIYGKNT